MRVWGFRLGSGSSDRDGDGRELLEAFDAIVWAADPRTLRGGLLNLRSAERLGFASRDWDDVTGVFERYVSEGDKPVVLRALRATAGDGRVRRTIFRLETPHAATRWFRMKLLRVGEDAAARVLGVMEDVTGRVLAEQDEAQGAGGTLERILRQLPAVVYTTDRELRVTSATGGGLTRLGLSPSQALGRMKLAEYLGIESADHPILASHRKALAGEAVEYEGAWLGRAFQTRLEPFRDEAGDVVGTLGVALDVTAHRRAELALRRERDFNTALVDTLAALVIVLDRQGRIARFNRACERLTGYREAEVLGQEFFELLMDAREAAEVRARFGELLGGESPKRFENTWVTRHRARRLIAWSTTALAGEGGEPEFVIATGIDITEQQAAERELRASEARLRLFFAQLPAIVWTTDCDLRFTSTAGAQRVLLQLRDPNAWIGRSLSGFFGTDDPGHPGIAAHRRALAGEQAEYEVEYRGRIFRATVEPLIDPRGRVAGVVGVSIDVTRHRRAQELLRQANERLEAIIGSAPLAIVSLAVDGAIEMMNPAAEALFRVDCDAVVGRSFEVLTGGSRGFAELRERVGAGESVTGQELRCASRRGGDLDLDLSVSAAPLHDALGGVAGVLAIFADVRERRRAEQERERLLSLLRATLEATADGILVVDLDGRMVNYNQKFLELAGQRGAGAPGDGLVQEIAERFATDRDAFLGRIEEIQRDPSRTSHDELVLRDGRVLERTSQPQLLGERIVGRVWSFRDITERRRAEGELARSKQLYEELVNAVDSIVWEADPGPRFTFVSPQAERLLGYPRERWYEAGFWESRIEPGDRAWVPRYCQDMVAAGVRHDLEYRMTAADGRAVWVRDIVSVETEGGRVVKLRGLMLDVTAAHEAQAERERLLAREREARAAAEHAQRRAAFLSRASSTLAASLDYEETLEEVARLAVPEMADWCAVHLVDEESDAVRAAVAHGDPARADEVRALKARQRPVRRDRERFPLSFLSGRPEWIEHITEELLGEFAEDEEHLRILRALGCESLVSAPLQARGRLVGGITLVYAPSSGRHYRADDLELAVELGRRAALAVDNAWLYRKAHDAIRARDEFLSIASHELRTPCTSLQLGVQSMLRFSNRGGIDKAPPHLVRSVLETAERQSKRLSLLVDKLLDVSRIGAGRLQLDLEPVDLAAMVRDVVAGFREDLAAAGSALTVHADEPVVGRWDRARVSQVVTNLVSNAIKYGGGNPIAVSVWREGDRARVEVRDQGIGIPAEKQAHVFDRFERAVDPRSYGGLGLGLFIVRQIALALGGDVTVQSAPGQGSRFLVDLPLSGPPGDVRAAQPEASP